VSRGKVIPLRRGSPSDVAEISDEALVAACAVGDRGALGLMFDRHQRAVYRFLGRTAGTDARDLDDLVQATFLEAYGAARRYRGGSSVRAWLFGIAVHVTSHHVRSEVRRRALRASLAEQPAARAARPDETVERGELLTRIGEALADLPRALRVAYVMCVLEEIPGVEAARTLGIPEGTLWRQLYQARQALRAALEGRRP
jgi:RNA polymerase sigma-70 factor (ECF subfamily)